MKIASEKRVKIASAREHALLAEARADEAFATYSVLVREALVKIGAPIEHSAICLSCGTIIAKDAECPECKKGSVNEISQTDSEFRPGDDGT